MFVQVSYTFVNLEGRSVTLHDEITIGAYKRLSAVQPSSPLEPGKEEAVIAVDSSLHFVWSGGPEPWVDEPESHFHQLTVGNDGDGDGGGGLVKASARVESKPALANGLYVFEIRCLDLGETTLTLQVGNRKSSHLSRPAVAKARMKVVCGQWDKIKLIPKIPRPAGLTCPLSAR